jgi:hypothetical protein
MCTYRYLSILVNFLDKVQSHGVDRLLFIKRIKNLRISILLQEIKSFPLRIIIHQSLSILTQSNSVEASFRAHLISITMTYRNVRISMQILMNWIFHLHEHKPGALVASIGK